MIFSAMRLVKRAAPAKIRRSPARRSRRSLGAPRAVPATTTSVSGWTTPGTAAAGSPRSSRRPPHWRRCRAPGRDLRGAKPDCAEAGGGRTGCPGPVLEPDASPGFPGDLLGRARRCRTRDARWPPPPRAIRRRPHGLPRPCGDARASSSSSSSSRRARLREDSQGSLMTRSPPAAPGCRRWCPRAAAIASAPHPGASGRPL